MSEPVAEKPPVIISYEDFAKLDFRVATILTAVPVPDKLVNLTVDLGELGQRQIVAGIKQHYAEDQLVNKQIMVLVNLEPRKMRGIMSQGMLLAAWADGVLALLSPDKPIAPGSKIQ